MSEEIDKHKRILIVGDSGRGKTFLADALSEKLTIKSYSTDDFFWKVKFTVPEDKQKSIEEISKIYRQKSWIVEGSTRSLISEGIDKADVVIHLVYPNIFAQFWTLFKRNLGRKEESLLDLLRLFKHLLFKRYKIGAQSGKEGIDKMLVPYKNKVILFSSFDEINNFVERLWLLKSGRQSE